MVKNIIVILRKVRLLLAAVAIFMVLILCSLNLTAQQQTQASERTQRQLVVSDEMDTIQQPVVVKRIHSPIKATMLSATLPGLGQAYNRKYWKIPIVYAGFGGVLYAFNFNNSNYQKYRKAWVARVDGNPNTVDDYPAYSADQLQRATNYYLRNLEWTYIAGAAIYLLNILDATVDAHLLDFDVDENLSMKISPVFSPYSNSFGNQTREGIAGLKLTLRF